MGKIAKQHFFILIFFLSLSSAFAQSSLNQKIDLKADQKPLVEVMEIISDVTNLEFAYQSKLIPSNTLVDLNYTQKPVKEILDTIFSDLNIEWILLNDQIVLKKAKVKKLSKAETYTLSGTVKDAETGELLIGVNIFNRALLQGTITNEYGFYSISFPPGNYDLEFSYTGYNKYTEKYEFYSSRIADISMQPNNALLEEVVVTPDELTSEMHLKHPSKIELKPHSINRIPNVMGEPDVIKAIQFAPGVTSLYEGASSFYVRGGNRDQNLILVDDAPVYNPSHFFGLFSAFDQNALKEISIVKSGIGARYGGRLSSVLDIRMNDGNKERFSVSGGLGLVSARLSINGPIVKGKSSIMLSGRRSVFGYLLTNATQSDFNSLYFYDLSGKVNLQLNRNNRLFFSFYTGRDSYGDKNSNQNFNGINWFNALTTLRWNHIYNSKWFSNITFLYSTYHYYLGNPGSQQLVWHSQIENTSLLADVSHYMSPNSTLRFGYKVTGHLINPGRLNANYPGNVPEKKATEQAFYISNDLKINQKFSINYGLRIPVFNTVGVGMTYSYNDEYQVIDSIDFTNNQQVYSTYAFMEPRLNFKYMISDNHIVSLSYERHHQFLNLLSNLSGSLTSVEVWLPADKTIKPQVADQINLGYFTHLFRKQLSFSTELYYKYLQNQVDYKDHAQLLLNPHIEGELRFGDGWAYGLELSLSKEIGKYTGMISYSFSQADKQIKDVNYSNAYRAIYDRPQEFSITFSMVLSRHWLFSGNWIYATGSPLTTPSSFYYYQGDYVPIYHERNNDRFPDYHRLDIAATVRTDPSKNKRFNHSLTIAIYNLYGRKNPISINFNKIENKDGELVVSNDVCNSVDRVITQMYIYSFIPSLTYNFKF